MEVSDARKLEQLEGESGEDGRAPAGGGLSQTGVSGQRTAGLPGAEPASIQLPLSAQLPGE